MQKATFAAGCFWCTETLFKRLKGVSKVTSGYSGGDEEDPSYKEVSRGETEHFESIQITFDPKKISYKDLVYVFFRTHDASDPGGQGADRGDQYRSAIFYHSPEQERDASKAKKEAQEEYESPIATQILAFKSFFPAEDYHQDYYEKNKSSGYCRLVIDPKISKLQKNFGKYLK